MSRGIAIVGVGGLGAPAAVALAAAGLDRLTLVDPDVVESSNLPRQPLFGDRDLGRPKVEAASERLCRERPGLRIESVVARVDPASAVALLSGHAAILDGTDGLESKVLLNEVAVETGIPLVHAGAVGLEGQLFSILPGSSACLRCLFVELPDPDDMPTCQQSGILGPVVGAVGLAAAKIAWLRKPARVIVVDLLAYRLAKARAVACAETIDASLEAPIPARLADRLAIFSGRDLLWRTIELRRHPRCPACSGIPVSRLRNPAPDAKIGAGSSNF